MLKIFGETNFHPREFPQSGSKAKDEERKKRNRKLVITMASIALQRHLGWHTQSRLGQLNQNCTFTDRAGLISFPNCIYSIQLSCYVLIIIK